MAPSRNRANYEDTRSDIPRDRNGALAASANKHKKATGSSTNAGNVHKYASGMHSATQAAQSSQQGEFAGMTWPAEHVSVLHSYRHAYHISSPGAFRSELSAAVLTGPGIGLQSPTMARRKEKRSVSREQLGTAVRKHFNSLAVNEIDVVVDFLYTVKNQDKSFKIRFAPSKKT